MVLSSWQSHCDSSPGSFDECRTPPSGRRSKTKPDDLGCVSACTGCQSLHPPSQPFCWLTACISLTSVSSLSVSLSMFLCLYVCLCLSRKGTRQGSRAVKKIDSRGRIQNLADKENINLYTQVANGVLGTNLEVKSKKWLFSPSSELITAI